MNWLLLRRFLLLWLGSSGFALAQVRVGQTAPPLVFGKIVQGNPVVLGNGKPTLLEFWGTWCGPCVQSIPHLNQLAEQFEARGLQFVSITPEDAPTVEHFLKTHPMRGVVALDPGQALFKRYGAGTPSTVLVDASGHVVRKVQPSQITDDVLHDLVLDRPVQLPAIRDDMYPTQSGSASDASTIVKVSIAPASKPGANMAMFASDRGSTETRLTAAGETLSALLAFTYELPPYRVVVSHYLQGGYYAVNAWVPENHGELLRPLLKNALQAAVDYQTRTEKRTFAVLVLEGLPGKVQAAQGLSIRNEKGLISADGWTLPQLAKDLEAVIKRPIVIDRVPSGKFQWHLHWNADLPHALEKALGKQLGLRLRPERRSLPVLIVDAADSGESSR